MARPSIRDDLALFASYHSPQVSVDVRLNTNESPTPPPAEFSEAVARAAAATEWHRYPDRAAGALRSRLAGLHPDAGAAAGLELAADHVFVANGSNEVLQTILLTFAGAGRTVATFEPTYALHAHLAKISGARVIDGGRGDDFLIDVDAAEAWLRAEPPAVVFTCSPNNPTGIVEPPATLERLADLADELGFLLVVDEAYGQFAPWSAEALLAEDRNVVVSRTYSKTWAMAAARIGYLLAPTWVVAELEKVVLPYHLDALKQAAGLAALDFVDDMERRVAEAVEERGRIEARLLDLGCTVWPSGANFVLFRPPAGDGDRVWQGLVDRSVLVRNTASWPHLEGCLRVTIGTPDENSRFLSALEEVLT